MADTFTNPQSTTLSNTKLGVIAGVTLLLTVLIQYLVVGTLFTNTVKTIINWSNTSILSYILDTPLAIGLIGLPGWIAGLILTAITEDTERKLTRDNVHSIGIAAAIPAIIVILGWIGFLLLYGGPLQLLSLSLSLIGIFVLIYAAIVFLLTGLFIFTINLLSITLGYLTGNTLKTIFHI